MLRLLIVLIFLLSTTVISAQTPTILVFDLQNGTVDSITGITYDTTLSAASTPFSLGNYNGVFAPLEDQPPSLNVYPNSAWTYKRQASLDYTLTDFPIRTSVRTFKIENDSLKTNCSGSMISERHVLTAAHCVAGINTDTLKYDSMYVCPIFDNGMMNGAFDCSAVRKIYFFRGWTFNGEDFAVLELEDPIGIETGYLGFGFDDNDTALQSGLYYKFSYPGITMLSLDSNEYNGDTLYYNYGKMDLPQPNFLGIDGTSGIPGESGSSLTKVENGLSYTTYGVLTFASNLRHSRLTAPTYAGILAVIEGDLTGIDPLDDPREIRLYPNPAHATISLDIESHQTIQNIAIYNLAGQLVLESENRISPAKLDVSDLKKGMYLIKAMVGDELYVVRFVME